MAKTKPSQSAPRPTPSHKRGRKSNIETLENIADTYESTTPEDIKVTIAEWEQDSEEEDTEISEQQERMEFILDLGNIRGRVSLFQQTIKTYWKFKCVLARAMESLQKKELKSYSLVLFELQAMKQEMRESRRPNISKMLALAT